VKRYPMIACPVALLAFALLAWVPDARATVVVTGPAAHASAGGVHLREHRAASPRARHHGASGAQFGRHHAPPGAPAPRDPARQRAEHRAALPAQPRGHRHAPTSRQGHALLVSTGTTMSTSIAERVDALADDSISIREGRVTSGRGPPRARRFVSLLPASLPGSLLIPRSVAPPDRSSRPTHPAVPTARAVPRPLAGNHAVSRPEHPETVSGRSHVRRPEGTAACLTTPSSGEAP
jgi:hypothetical protein